MFKDIYFAHPEFFFLFIIIPLAITWYILKHKKQSPAIHVSSLNGFANTVPTLKVHFRHSLFVLRILAISLIIIALARPQSSSSKRNVSSEGIDIVMALDVSTSMLAEDLKPNRIEAAKKTALNFIDNRIDDRIGLVIFSGTCFTQCPITIDHAVLKNLFQSIKCGMIQDGTAMGVGLATAVARLKDGKSKSKTIILLTDGINNMGFIDPMTAAEIAKTFNIRVYTIGVGTLGMAPYPFKTPFGTQYQNVKAEVDEALLKQIAKMTNGQYYRATNTKALENIYNEIDKLEKTRIEVTEFTHHTEEFFMFALAGAILFIFELLLRYLVYRKIP